jgi:hypothetical protein
MRWLGFVFLMGCGAIDLAAETPPCEDVDLGGEPVVSAVLDGEDVRIFRMPVFVGDQDVFAPQLSFEGTTIFVREAWDVSDESEADVCRGPTIRLLSPPERTFTIEWYLGDAVIPDYRFKVNAGDL